VQLRVSSGRFTGQWLVRGLGRAFQMVRHSTSPIAATGSIAPGHTAQLAGSAAAGPFGSERS